MIRKLLYKIGKNFLPNYYYYLFKSNINLYNWYDEFLIKIYNLGHFCNKNRSFAMWLILYIIYIVI